MANIQNLSVIILIPLYTIIHVIKTNKIAFHFIRNLLRKWFASKMAILLVYRE